MGNETISPIGSGRCSRDVAKVFAFAFRLLLSLLFLDSECGLVGTVPLEAAIFGVASTAVVLAFRVDRLHKCSGSAWLHRVPHPLRIGGETGAGGKTAELRLHDQDFGREITLTGAFSTDPKGTGD